MALFSGEATEDRSWIPNFDFGVRGVSESSWWDPRYTTVPLVEASSSEVNMFDCLTSQKLKVKSQKEKK